MNDPLGLGIDQPRGLTQGTGSADWLCLESLSRNLTASAQSFGRGLRSIILKRIIGGERCPVPG